ncbi:MAG: hypothetical protein M9897_10945 [Brumimicrobium sp.]|nr:hypothetical protein [Brumimicrobium sp.]
MKTTLFLKMKKGLLFITAIVLSTLSLTAFSQNYTIELVKNINPSGDSNPIYFGTYNGKLYFHVNDGINGFVSCNLNTTTHLKITT